MKRFHDSAFMGTMILASLAVLVVVPASARAQGLSCATGGRALSDIQPASGGGFFTRVHFGEITSSSCQADSVWKITLMSRLLASGDIANETIESQGPAVFGASMRKEVLVHACSGEFRATTHVGSRRAPFSPIWLHQDASPIHVANCPPPPPPPGPPSPPDDPCSQGTAATSTWTLADGEAPSRAPLQLGFGHSRYERRPEGHVFLDEWAVLAVRGNHPTVRFASSADFRDRVMERIELQVGGRPQNTTLLVIEAADHPQNHRHIPVPSIVPFEVDLELPGKVRPPEAWFRAEVSAQGVVDRVMILESSGLAAQRHVESALRENLELDYADEGRHRSVIFGRAAVTAAGRLSVDDALVVVPQCCWSPPK